METESESGEDFIDSGSEYEPDATIEIGDETIEEYVSLAETVNESVLNNKRRLVEDRAIHNKKNNSYGNLELVFMISAEHIRCQHVVMGFIFSTELSEREIQNMLSSNELEKVCRDKFGVKRFKSEVWGKYHILINPSEDKIVSNYVSCINCNKLVKYFSSSTTSLQRHTCDTEIKITTFFHTTNTQNKCKISRSDMKKIREAAVKLIAKDLRPFIAIEGDGKYTSIR